MSEENRGSGRTYRQMKHAPKGAIFIWVNEALNYPTQMANSMNREDLKIYGPSVLEAGRLQGFEVSGIIIDHAVDLTEERLKGLERLMPMVRPK